MITTLAAKCDTSAPPAMMFIDGDEDPLASYDGNATLMSLPASAAFWAQANGCNMTPRREALADIVDDGTHTLQIGRAPVCTPVTNAQLVCRLLLETKKTKNK